MKIINIQAAKTHLSRIVEQVSHGEEIVLAKAGKPLVKLVPYKGAQSARVGGQLKGQIWEAPDCWQADDKLIKQMTESPLYHQSDGASPKVAEDAP